MAIESASRASWAVLVPILNALQFTERTPPQVVVVINDPDLGLDRSPFKQRPQILAQSQLRTPAARHRRAYGHPARCRLHFARSRLEPARHRLVALQEFQEVVGVGGHVLSLHGATPH